jgi:ribosomal protein S18 acetylase RimI-like enzyme
MRFLVLTAPRFRADAVSGVDRPALSRGCAVSRAILPHPPMTGQPARPHVIRLAQAADLPAVARLAAVLVRYHHALDPDRFLLVEPVEEGYARFFAHELKDPRAVVLAATWESGEIVGYAYGRFEPRDWNLLLDAHGALHDVLVAEEARGAGIGGSLVRAMCKRLEALGAPRVVLSTAVQNTMAQAVFEKAGFRRTMIEMTREKD